MTVHQFIQILKNYDGDTPVRVEACAEGSQSHYDYEVKTEGYPGTVFIVAGDQL